MLAIEKIKRLSSIRTPICLSIPLRFEHNIKQHILGEFDNKEKEKNKDTQDFQS